MTSATSATVTNHSDMKVCVQLEFTDEYSIVKKTFRGTYIDPGLSVTVKPNSNGTITGFYVMYPERGAAVNYVPVSNATSYYITPPLWPDNCFKEAA